MAESDGKELERTEVVTCFLRNRGDVLLLKRSDEVGSYQGRWGAVAGHAEGDPDEAARAEIDEETGLLDACTLVRRGESFPVEDAALATRWIVHPYLFDCSRRDAVLDWESVEAEWVPPIEILERNAVPQLWTSYRRVAPTVASVGSDRAHGSAWLSARALEVLRDAAAEADPPTWDDLVGTAEALLSARPSMSALQQRVHRAMYRAGGDPGRLAACAQEVLRAAMGADDAAAERAAALVGPRHALTISRSGTVVAALERSRGPVTVLSSLPLGEGRGVAERLADGDRDVALAPDAAMAETLRNRGVEIVLIGADTVEEEGAVINKVGTFPLALVARELDVPVYAVAAADKIAPPGHAWDPNDAPRADRDEVYGGSHAVNIVDTLFERTHANLFAGIVTEDGVLDRAGVAEVAERHAEERRSWQQ